MSNYLNITCPICNTGIDFKETDEKILCPRCQKEIGKQGALTMIAGRCEKEDKVVWETPVSTWQPGEAEGLRIFSCQACGARVLADESSEAVKCPHCSVDMVMDEQVPEGIKPDVVIPFKIAKNDAIAALNKHYKGKRLLPKVFRDQNYVKQITPVFIPMWLFDGEGPVAGGYSYCKEKSWSDEDYEYKETSYYAAFREGTIAIENTPISGSSRMDDRFEKALWPYHFADAVSVEKGCLSGCLTAVCDVQVDACIPEAEEKITGKLKDMLRGTVDGANQTELGCNFDLKGRGRLALVPVWILNTRWNGQIFTFMMNGQTGEFIGDLPMDKAAYWKWMIGSGLGAAAAAVGVSALIWQLVLLTLR